MSKYYVKVFTDDSNVKEWEDLTPDKVNHIEFKGKWFDEVRYGRWIPQEYMSEIDSFIYTEYKCSNCGETSKKKSNYCPNCGAKMDGDEK